MIRLSWVDRTWFRLEPLDVDGWPVGSKLLEWKRLWGLFFSAQTKSKLTHEGPSLTCLWTSQDNRNQAHLWKRESKQTEWKRLSRMVAKGSIYQTYLTWTAAQSGLLDKKKQVQVVTSRPVWLELHPVPVKSSTFFYKSITLSNTHWLLCLVIVVFPTDWLLQLWFKNNSIQEHNRRGSEVSSSTMDLTVRLRQIDLLEPYWWIISGVKQIEEINPAFVTVIL